MKRKPIDKQLVLQLVTESGKSPLYVAKEMSVGVQRVYNILFENGHAEYIPMPSQEIVNEIIRLYESGVCVNNIVREIGEPKYKVTFALKLNGYDPKSCFHTGRENKVDHHFFDVIDTEVKAYFLGFLYSDGTLNYNTNKYQIRLDLEVNDLAILERLKSEIKGTWDISFHEQVQKSGKVTQKALLNLYSKDLCKALVKAGCPQNKTYSLSFPDLSIVPEHLQHHFIRGFFDGDGSVYWTNPKIGGPSANWNFQGTQSFLEGVKSVFVNNGLTKGNIHPGHGDVFEFRGGGIPSTLRVMNFLYKDATIYLQRKLERFTEIKNYYCNKKNSCVTSKDVA